MRPLPAADPTLHDLIVVGAGVTGLAAAWRAAQAGEGVLLLEAAPRVGGVIRTERVGPYRVERAAASFPSNAPHMNALLESLPAPPAVRPPDPSTQRQFLLTRRGLVLLPKSPPAFLLSPLLSVRGRLRVLSEMLRGPRRASGSESAHGFVRRRFGIEAAERVLRPATLGIYGSDPQGLGLADAFPTLAEMEREGGSVLLGFMRKAKAAKAAGGGTRRRAIQVFADGMEAFPRAVAQALGDRVRLGVAVERVDVQEGTVRLACGDGVDRTARRVVLATTAFDQARLLAPISPMASEILAAVRYVPMVVVAVGLAPGESPPIPDAFGFLRSPGAPVRILGASFPSRLNPAVAPEGHALVTAFIGGGSDPDAVLLSDEEVRAVVERDLSFALGGSVRPSTLSICRWPCAIPVLSPGHRSRMATAQRLVTPHHLLLSGSHVTGVGVHSCCVPVAP